MRRRPVRAAAALLLLVLASTSCEMKVRMHTVLDASGGGRFQLAVDMDRELVAGLAGSAAPAEGLAEVEALFARLEAAGWSMARAEREGGLQFRATASFVDPAGLEQVLGDVERAGGSREGVLPIPDLALRIRRADSLWRTETRIDALVDAGVPEGLRARASDLVEAVRDELSEVLSYEVVIEAPGAAVVEQGPAAVEDGHVVWRPQIGARERLVAAAQATKPGAAAGLLAALVALAGAAWWAVTRRRGAIEIVVEALPLEDEEVTADPDEPTLERVFGQASLRRTVVLEPRAIVLEEEPLQPAGEPPA